MQNILFENTTNGFKNHEHVSIWLEIRFYIICPNQQIKKIEVLKMSLKIVDSKNATKQYKEKKNFEKKFEE